MQRTSEFWTFFDLEAAPQLARREPTFRQMFQFLDRIDHPVTIVETGCVRTAGNWLGDGQSTVLFDRYISSRDTDSIVYSVDINATSVAQARALVSDRVKLTCEDSVAFLTQLVGRLRSEGKTIDLLYLDSFDIDWLHWYPSAIHHLKELCAAMRAISRETLVAVDDCPLDASFVPHSDKPVEFVQGPFVGGKGRLVADFAAACGAQNRFAAYQAGWTGF